MDARALKDRGVARDVRAKLLPVHPHSARPGTPALYPGHGTEKMCGQEGVQGLVNEVRERTDVPGPHRGHDATRGWGRPDREVDVARRQKLAQESRHRRIRCGRSGRSDPVAQNDVTGRDASRGTREANSVDACHEHRLVDRARDARVPTRPGAPALPLSP